jgi:hypothetical protein
MTAGLQVIGPSSVLQIDETFRNLAFIQKGTVSGNPATLVLSNRTTPVLALGGDNLGAIWSVSVSGSTYTYTIYTSGTVTYYLFDVPPTPPLHGAGLQVFTSAGLIAFDSEQRYMKPKGEIVTSISGGGAVHPPSGAFVAVSGAKPAGATYALAPIIFPWFMDIDHPSAGQITIGTFGFYWSGNDLMGQRFDNIISSGGGTNVVNQGTFGLIDVAGL